MEMEADSARHVAMDWAAAKAMVPALATAKPQARGPASCSVALRVELVGWRRIPIRIPAKQQRPKYPAAICGLTLAWPHSDPPAVVGKAASVRSPG